MNASRLESLKPDAYAFRRSQRRNRGRLLAFIPLAFVLYVLTGVAFEAMMRSWALALVGSLQTWGAFGFETVFVFVDEWMRAKYGVVGPDLMSPLTVLDYWKVTLLDLVTFKTVPWLTGLFVSFLLWKTWARWRDPLTFFSKGLTLVGLDLSRADHVQLSNVLEEVIVAVGLEDRPTLRVAQSAAPFAFSVETSTQESAIVISQGLLENLDRNELRSVVTHEAAHLKADDHVLNCLISVSTQWWDVGSFDSLKRGLHAVGEDSILLGGWSEEKARVMVLVVIWAFLAAVATALSLAVIAGFFALKLLGKAFVGRRRDFMADAHTVEALRDNESLGRAILKHWICYHERRIPIDKGEAYRANYLFVNPYQLDDAHSRMWHPQPSVMERLRAIGVGDATFQKLENWEPKLSVFLDPRKRRRA